MLGALVGVTLRGLGYYSGASNLHFDVVSIGKNLTVLFYGAGWAIVPGAALGIGLCIVRPRSRAEAAFGWLAASFGAALLLEAAVWGDSSLVQERYLFYVLPLAGVAFCVQAARGWPLPRVQAVLAAGLLLLSVRVPLSGWAQPGTDDHSPFLLAVERLQLWFGTSTGDLVVATVAALLSVAAAFGPWRPRIALPALLGASIVAAAASLAGVTALDHSNSLRCCTGICRPSARGSMRRTSGTRRSSRRPATGRATARSSSSGTARCAASRCSRRSPPDRLAAANVSIDSHGVLHDRGRTVQGPLVVDGYASTVEFRNARVVASAPRDRLVVPQGVARLRLYVIGRSTDGLLVSSRGAILFWTDRPGVLVVRVNGGDLHVGGKAIKGSRLLRLPVCNPGRFVTSFQATLDRFTNGRPAGGSMSLPRSCPAAAALSRGIFSLAWGAAYAPYPPDLADDAPPVTELEDLDASVARTTIGRSTRARGRGAAELALPDRTEPAEATLADVTFTDAVSTSSVGGTQSSTVSSSGPAGRPKCDFVDARSDGRPPRGRRDPREPACSGVRLKPVELRGCDSTGLRSVEALRGARMPWS